MLLMEETFERVKCEDLEKIVVGDDLEKFFFKSELSYLFKRRES